MLLVHGKVHYGRARRGRYLYVGNPEPWEVGTNSKGCDIGYALAANSCEGVDDVDACTVTALDAITAFAVPNPGCTSQCPPVFSGLATLRITPSGRSPSLLRFSNLIEAQPFGRRRCSI